MKKRRCLNCGAVIKRAPYGFKDLLLYCGHSCAASRTNRTRDYTPGVKIVPCAEPGCDQQVTVHAHAPAAVRCAPHRHARLLARKRGTAERKKASRSSKDQKIL